MASVVAGIIDKKGRLRVVVTQRWRIRHHVKTNERLFVLPGLKVQEPVPWDDIPSLIHKVHVHVARSVAPTNKCGDCRACCKTLFIREPEFEKPSHRMCGHACEIGCKIYWARPKPCRSFECLWLKSQGGNDEMGPELRPDRCGVIFTGNTLDPHDLLTFEVHPDDGMVDHAMYGPAREWIDRMQERGMKAKLVTHYVGEGER